MKTYSNTIYYSMDSEKRSSTRKIELPIDKSVTPTTKEKKEQRDPGIVIPNTPTSTVCVCKATVTKN